MGQRRGRRRRVDPSKLDLSEVTGEENVAVINRETGKRITGAKAPPLRYLKEWLVRNPGFDVDPKWAHIVQATVRDQYCQRLVGDNRCVVEHSAQRVIGCLVGFFASQRIKIKALFFLLKKVS